MSGNMENLAEQARPEQALLELAQERRPGRVRRTGRAVPGRAARPWLPHARFGARRRRRAPGRTAASLAWPARLRGPQLGAFLAAHHPQQRRPGPHPAPGPPRGAGRVQPGGHLAEPPWLEPYPDGAPGDPRLASPEARYELRESLELALVIALQHLPPAQRAVLILRDVVGLSAAEMASQLGTTVPAITSALQRARASVRRPPARPHPAGGAALARRRAGQGPRQPLRRRDRAGRCDLLVSMLTRDATWTMPPECECIRGTAAIREFIRNDVGSERWQHRATRANGQLAIGCYTWAAGRAGTRPRCWTC